MEADIQFRSGAIIASVFSQVKLYILRILFSKTRGRDRVFTIHGTKIDLVKAESDFQFISLAVAAAF